MNRFKINSEGKKWSAYTLKESKKMFITGPLVILFLGGLMYIRFYDTDFKAFILFETFIFILGVGVYVVAPSYLSRKINRTINSIEIENNTVQFRTCEALGRSEKSYSRELSQIKVNYSRYLSHYKKGEDSEGILLSFDDKEYVIVQHFFDDFSKIKQSLL